MPIRIYLRGIVLLAIFCLIAIAVIIFETDPNQIDIKIFSAFFASLFLALVSIFTLFGYFIRLRVSQKEIVYAHLGVSFRQAVLLSLALIGLLLLQATQVLNWWDGILLITAILLLELFFRTK